MPYQLSKKDFENARGNEHYRIFLESKGLKEGDEIAPFDYDLWLADHASAFKKVHGLTVHQSIGLVPDWKNAFTRFIRERHDEHTNHESEES